MATGGHVLLYAVVAAASPLLLTATFVVLGSEHPRENGIAFLSGLLLGTCIACVLAPAVATGSVANPLVGVILGIALLRERLAPPTWHKAVAFAALGCALVAAVAISLSEERERRTSQSPGELRTGAAV